MCRRSEWIAERWDLNHLDTGSEGPGAPKNSLTIRIRNNNHIGGHDLPCTESETNDRDKAERVVKVMLQKAL